MSGIRSITRRGTGATFPAGPASAPIYVTSSGATGSVNALLIVPAGTGSTEIAVGLAATASGFRFAAGTGTLASGVVVVATGLSTVLSFTTTMSSTGATATGATEVETVYVDSITTGAVTVAGAYHSGTAAVMVPSTASSNVFYWLAFGT